MNNLTTYFTLLYSFFYTIFMVIVLFTIFLHKIKFLEPFKVASSLLLSFCLIIFVVFVYVPEGVNKDLLYFHMGFTYLLSHMTDLILWIAQHQTFIYYFNYLGFILNLCAIYFMFQAWIEFNKKNNPFK